MKQLVLAVGLGCLLGACGTALDGTDSEGGDTESDALNAQIGPPPVPEVPACPDGRLVPTDINPFYSGALIIGARIYINNTGGACRRNSASLAAVKTGVGFVAIGGMDSHIFFSGTENHADVFFSDTASVIAPVRLLFTIGGVSLSENF